VTPYPVHCRVGQRKGFIYRIKKEVMGIIKKTIYTNIQPVHADEYGTEIKAIKILN
jgi:hypothetical protein